MSIQPEEICQNCGSERIWKNAHPYPVILQTIFAVSFLGFILFLDRLQQHRNLIWAWSFMQIALGILLIRGRLRAKKRILHCIRCAAALPSNTQSKFL